MTARFYTRKSNYKFIPVTKAPNPKPPRFWEPTPAEIKRNSLLRDIYSDINKKGEKNG